MKEKITNGWIYGKTRDDKNKIHNCLLRYNELDEATKDNDRNPIREIPGLLRGMGLGILKEIN
jgi:hypothetical protein